jgi:RES domain
MVLRSVRPAAARRDAEFIDQRRVRWSQACRIVPTRYPAINLFDRVADAADFEALYALEAMSNERLREELGQVERVPRDERVFGPGSGPIMAAFTHVNVLGSRFSAGQFGVFYAARQRATAVAETRYHHSRFLAATNEAAMHLPMRLYHVAIDAKLHDLRPQGTVSEAVYSPSDYGASQALGARLHAAGSAGVAYRSVRHDGGQCVGLFKPKGASACVHAAYLLYAWDGQRFGDIYEKTE